MAVEAKEENLQGAGNVKLFIRSWRPEAKPKAVVVIVHGFNSHSGHYLWVADQLVAAGFAVYALDLRGRGKSEGERWYVDNIAEYLGDVDALVKLAKSHEPGLPVFLFGHSAGGVISCNYTLDHQAELAGLICESFAFRVPAPEFALTILRGLSHIIPHVRVLDLKREDFSRDPKVVQALLNDPYVIGEKQPARTVAAMLRGNDRIERDFPLMTLPVLIIHGTADKVTVPAGSQFFFDTVGSKDKTLKLYEGFAHDPLNDIDKEKVMADIKAWITARLPAAA